jgi:cellulose synthase/poly-beta-1,6-N-acetylglucosamine synthase-like glycosyltransferase
LIAAHNEERRIKQRLKNLLAMNYPKQNMEIFVASDGSSDRTVAIVNAFEHEAVKVLDFRLKRGRAAVHNEGIKVAKNEIIVFTDSETVFDKNYLRRSMAYFADSRVGCVIGNLIYIIDRSSVSQSEGLYWKIEKQLRRTESELGLLGTGTGACMAMRKSLWKELGATDDCDFTTPLDVILQGFRVIYASDSIAYDVPASTLRQEFRTRVRQTAKNLVGTLRRWGWKGWIKHPFVSLGLLSHKILRWFSPFFIVGALLSNLFLLDENLVYQITFLIQLAFYALGFFGLLGEVLGKKIPVASSVLAFCVAAAGMGIGVIKGILGKAPANYQSG